MSHTCNIVLTNSANFVLQEEYRKRNEKERQTVFFRILKAKSSDFGTVGRGKRQLGFEDAERGAFCERHSAVVSVT